MIDARLLDPILPEIETFIVAVGWAPSAFGTRAVGDPTFVHELRRGRECKRATRAKIRGFIAAHKSINEAV